ncbi:MAG: oxygen-dependent coproporphyrinogen oxidase [Pseudomonas fluorescens]|nr:MAG: oxygen-dependent coproporphyrinogen oxidase [Pseudomonas fluorescens]
MTAPTPLAQQAESYFRGLQTNIIASFQRFEPNVQFVVKPWEKEPGAMLQGGGITALIRGEVFEKMGVNFSCVHGTFPEHFRKEIPGAVESEGRFWASGVSLVCHPANPHVPGVHMNVRRIETSRGWFGGGADLTPALPYQNDTQHFHDTLQAACNTYGPTAYQDFRKWCDDYFFIPHRNEARGVGGIFYDYLEDRPEETFAFTQNIGQSFLQSYLPLVETRKDTPFTEAERHSQLLKRGRYAEFNLMYDRGTRFGLLSGGNIDAILMSLPPQAAW